MRSVIGASAKTQVERFHTLSMRMGVAGTFVTNVGGETGGPEGLTRGKSN